jgi:hypothetical protein
MASFYEYSERYQRFEQELHEKLAHFFENPGISDNPVSDFIGHKNAFFEERFEREKTEMIWLMETLFKVVRVNFSLCRNLLKLRKSVEPEAENENIGSLVFDFFPFDLLLTRFINTRWELLPMSMLDMVDNAIQNHRVLFLPVHQAWEAVRINPSQEACDLAFNLAEAALETEQADVESLENDVLVALKNLSYTVTYSPKKTEGQGE